MKPSHTPSVGTTEPSADRIRKFNFWRLFWLMFLVVSLAYAFYCYYIPSNSIAWADSHSAAQKRAIESGKPMILYFTGNWCVPCRVMKRQVWADKEVAASVNLRFIPVAIDIDNPNHAELLARYNVGGAPVTIITDPQGNALRWKAGGMGKADFLALLAEPNPAAVKDM
jgi:thioredoxin 1